MMNCMQGTQDIIEKKTYREITGLKFDSKNILKIPDGPENEGRFGGGREDE